MCAIVKSPREFRPAPLFVFPGTSVTFQSSAIRQLCANDRRRISLLAPATDTQEKRERIHAPIFRPHSWDLCSWLHHRAVGPCYAPVRISDFCVGSRCCRTFCFSFGGLYLCCASECAVLLFEVNLGYGLRLLIWSLRRRERQRDSCSCRPFSSC